MKNQNDVVKEFNQYVNMTASELEKWLKSSDSQTVGWSKDDGGGESVGHDSGRKIVSILKANPKKDPKKYTDDQIDHMRKVAAYCKRHRAQEMGPNSQKSTEEVKNSKSYASLKNWGHDPLRKLGSSEGTARGQDSGNEEGTAGTGQKRKAPSNNTKQSKRQQTTASRKSERIRNQTQATNDTTKATNGTTKKQQQEKETEDEGGDKQENRNGSKKSDSKKPSKGPKPGDVVSWNWGSGRPEGKVLDVKGEKTTITTKRGNKVSREGDTTDPAVVLDAGKSKAIKFNHELNQT